MKSITFFLFLTFSATIALSQSFFKRYSDGDFNSLTITDNGKLFIAGNKNLTKTDIAGNIVFSKTYQGLPVSSFNCIIPAASDGAFLSFSSSYLHNHVAGLIRVDSSGIPLWSKQYFNFSSTSLCGISKLHDGKILITADDSARALLIKVDTSGNVVWSKQYCIAGNPFSISGPPVELPDHSIIFCGSARIKIYAIIPPNTFPMEYYVSTVATMKTDSLGNLLWGKTFYYTNPPPNLDDIELGGTSIFYSINKKFYVNFGVYNFVQMINMGYFTARLDSTGNFEFVNNGSWSPSKIISNNFDSSLNVLVPGGAFGDVYTPYTSYFRRVSQNLDILSEVKYQPFYYSNYTMRFGDAVQLADKRIAFAGLLADGAYSFQNTNSLLFADSMGVDNCISIIQNPVSPAPDTNFYTQSLTLLTDTGIYSNPLSVTATDIFPTVCDCSDNPVAGFSYSVSDSTVSFTNNSSQTTIYEWMFGDGNYDTSQNPIHTYADTGTYTVILVARNNCGLDTASVLISIPDNLNTINNFELNTSNISIFPNPTDQKIYIVDDFISAGNENAIATISDIRGRVITTRALTSNKTEMDLGEFPKGVYIIRVIDGEKSYCTKIIKM